VGMSSIINQMLVLFLILVIGYGAGRLGILNEAANRALSRLITNIILPCMILDSMLGSGLEIGGKEAINFVLLSAGTYVIILLVAMLTPVILRSSRRDAGVYRYMVAFTNVGFVGYPVAQAVFGEGALFYVALNSLIFNLTCFSIGILFMAGAGGRIDYKRVLLSPVLVVTVVAFAMFLLGLRFPAPVMDTFGTMGKALVPAGMLLVGASLCRMPIRSIFVPLRLYVAMLLRLIVTPVLVWLIFGLFVPDRQMLGILTILSALPVAMLCTVMAIEYGADEALASKSVFISTVLSVVTMPLLVYLLII
jgi:predicted permease